MNKKTSDLVSTFSERSIRSHHSSITSLEDDSISVFMMKAQFGNRDDYKGPPIKAQYRCQNVFTT